MNFLLSLIGGVGGSLYIYLAVLFAGFGSGFYLEHLRFSDYRQSVQLEAQKQIDANEALKKEQALINKGVTDAYNANIANIHTFYSGMHNASSGSMSYNADATVTINGKAVNVLLIAEQCADTTQQLQSLQGWIRDQVGLNDK
jgi:hypothetical protein